MKYGTGFIRRRLMIASIRNKRNHGIVIFEDSIKALANFIVPFLLTLIPAFRSGEFSGSLITIIIFIIFFGLGIIYSILEWVFKTYSIEDGVFKVRHGVFVKKNREIPIAKINTIHEMQTLSQRLFKACTLKLDTGSSLLKEAEVKLVVSLEDMAMIRKILSTAHEIMPDPCEIRVKPESFIVYQAHPVSLIKMGLTSNAIFAGLALILSILQFVPEFFEDRMDELIGQAEDYLTGTAIKITMEILLFLILVFIVYSIFSLLIAAVTSLVRYHDFKVFKEDSNVVIQYGLVKKNSYSIAESKIHALYIKQTFIRQILGYASVQIESVGYGNEKGEEALLIPLTRISDVHSLLMEILSDYRVPGPLVAAPKRSVLRFLAGTIAAPLLLIIPITLLYPYGFISLFMVPFFLLSGILQYRNTGVLHSHGKLFMGYGGFTRYYAQVKCGGIQAIIKKATPFQKVAKLFTLIISIHGTVFGKLLAVKHLDDAMFPELRDMV